MFIRSSLFKKLESSTVGLIGTLFFLMNCPASEIIGHKDSGVFESDGPKITHL